MEGSRTAGRRCRSTAEPGPGPARGPRVAGDVLQRPRLDADHRTGIPSRSGPGAPPGAPRPGAEAGRPRLSSIPWGSPSTASGTTRRPCARSSGPWPRTRTSRPPTTSSSWPSATPGKADVRQSQSCFDRAVSRMDSHRVASTPEDQVAERPARRGRGRDTGLVAGPPRGRVRPGARGSARSLIAGHSCLRSPFPHKSPTRSLERGETGDPRCASGAQLIQTGHEIGLGVTGRNGQVDIAGVGLLSVHTLFFIVLWTNVLIRLETPGKRAKQRGFSLRYPMVAPASSTGDSSGFASSDDRPGRVGAQMRPTRGPP